MAELGAFFGNPNLQRQGARARALAERRDVNTLADPLTYAVVQGLLGTAPDQMGFSVLNPDYEKIKKVAEPAFALGLLGQAAPLLAPLTKGLPVGASIKPINLEKGIYKADLTMEEMLKVRDIPTVERVQKSVELVGEKQFEKMVETQFKKYKPSSPEQEAMLVESVTLQVLGKAERSPFPRKEALDTAQRNAALPVKQGGLGLPKDNTPEMRAEAMGYKTPAYHGTTVWEAEDGRKLGDIEAFNRLASTEIVGRKPSIDQVGIFASDRPDQLGAGMYSGIQGAIYPLMLRMENPKSTSFEQMARTASNLSTNKALGPTEVPKVSDVEPYRQRLKEQGYDSLMLRAKEGSPYTEFVDQTGYVLLEPNQVRSRFAAFDPKRKNEADILAGVLPLGLLADEEQRKKLYELMPSLLGQ
jgi:hypothetical protein